MRVRVAACNFKENRVATIRLLAESDYDQWSDLNEEFEPPTTLAAFAFLSSPLTDWAGFDGPPSTRRSSPAPFRGREDVEPERNDGTGRAPVDGSGEKSSRSHRRRRLGRRPPHPGPGTAFAGPGQGLKYGAGASNSNDFPWKSCVESTSGRYVPNNQMYLRWKYNSSGSVRTSDEKLPYPNVKARNGNNGPRAKHVGSPTGRVSIRQQKTSVGLPPAAITNRSIAASPERQPPVASMYSLVKNGFISSPGNLDSMLRNRGNLEALLEMDRNAMKFRNTKNRISFPEAGKNLSDILRNPIYYIFPFSEKTPINAREAHSGEISKQELLSKTVESNRDTSFEDKEESQIHDTRLSSPCQVHLLHANEENTGDSCRPTVSPSNFDAVSRGGKETRFDTSEKEPRSQESSTNGSETKEIREENEEKSSVSTAKKHEERAPSQPSTEHLIIAVDDDSSKDEEELNNLLKISETSLPFQLQQTYYPPGLSASSTTESKASPSDRLENSEQEHPNAAHEYSNGAKFKSPGRDKAEKQRFEQLRLDFRCNRNANRLIRPRKLLRYRTNKLPKQNDAFRSHSPLE